MNKGKNEGYMNKGKNEGYMNKGKKNLERNGTE